MAKHHRLKQNLRTDMKPLFIAIILISLNACTWVELNKHASNVKVSSENGVNNCQKLGNITAKTRHDLFGQARDAEKVSSELITLARNEALKLNANTVVPSSEIYNGEQSYHAYYCPR